MNDDPTGRALTVETFNAGDKWYGMLSDLPFGEVMLLTGSYFLGSAAL